MTAFLDDRCAPESPRTDEARSSPGWLHLCNGLDPMRDGGMVPSILGFVHALRARARRLTVVTPTQSRLDLVRFDPEIAVFGPERLIGPWVSRADLVHMHGLWQVQTRDGGAAARRARVPYLISAHGMADPWALRHKRFKKAIYRLLVEDRNLRHAACLHALARSEVESLRSVAPKVPIALIPNGVDLRTLDRLPEANALWNARGEQPPDGCFNLLFLSRLHVKKGLDLLAEALIHLKDVRPRLHLLLAGRDEGARDPFLERIVGAGLSDRVTDLGHVSGETARQAWAAADGFVLPSYSEGFPMAVLEALAARRPVVITEACNFPEVARAGAGWVVPSTVPGVVNGIGALLECSDHERREIGARGRSLVERDYTWERQGARLAAVYAWILGGGVTPETMQP